MSHKKKTDAEKFVEEDGALQEREDMPEGVRLMTPDDIIARQMHNSVQRGLAKTVSASTYNNIKLAAQGAVIDAMFELLTLADFIEQREGITRTDTAMMNQAKSAYAELGLGRGTVFLVSDTLHTGYALVPVREAVVHDRPKGILNIPRLSTWQVFRLTALYHIDTKEFSGYTVGYQEDSFGIKHKNELFGWQGVHPAVLAYRAKAESQKIEVNVSEFSERGAVGILKNVSREFLAGLAGYKREEWAEIIKEREEEIDMTDTQRKALERKRVAEEFASDVPEEDDEVEGFY